MPGVNPATVAGDLLAAATDLGQQILTYPHVPAEPALACYVTASCPAGAASAKGTHKKKCKKKKKKKGKAAAKKCKKKKQKK